MLLNSDADFINSIRTSLTCKTRLRSGLLCHSRLLSPETQPNEMFLVLICSTTNINFISCSPSPPRILPGSYSCMVLNASRGAHRRFAQRRRSCQRMQRQRWDWCSGPCWYLSQKCESLNRECQEPDWQPGDTKTFGSDSGPLGSGSGPLVVSWWHLNHFSVQALSHFCPAMSQKNRTICVDMNQSSSLQNQRDMSQEPQGLTH